MNFLESWYSTGEQSLVAELQREVQQGHALFGVPVSVLARRQDRDDVLFELHDGSNRLAQVHLSWQPESNLAWPHTQLFVDQDAWLKSMKRDHEEYGA